MITAPTHHSQVLGVQLLRFIAAVLVVITHATLAIVERLNVHEFSVWENGGVGVNIFFVISGFVMVVSSQKLLFRNDGAKLFLQKRLIRIVPIYWFATSLKLSIVLLFPIVTLHSNFDYWHTLCSFLFIPAKNGEGVITPIHAVGWTLTYEMLFYCLFALALYLKKPAVLFVSTLFILLILISTFIDLSAWTIADYYSRPITLQFVMGMIIGLMHIKEFKFHPVLALLFLVFGFAQVLTELYIKSEPDWLSFLRWGLPSAMIVIGVVYLEPYIKSYIPKMLTYLGDGSYSLYIFHPFIIPAIGILLAKLGIDNPSIAMVILVIIPILLCQIIYLYLEAPITSYLAKYTANQLRR